MNVWLVGQNPSPHNKDPLVPFVGTRSYQILFSWLKYLGINKHGIMNVCNAVSSTGVPVLTPEDYMNLKIKLSDATHVIALGNVAAEALDEVGIEHFKLPHPSGRNRQLNNKEFVKERLKLCREFLKKDVKITK